MDFTRQGNMTVNSMFPTCFNPGNLLLSFQTNFYRIISWKPAIFHSVKPAFLDADFGLDIGTDMQTPASSPPAPPPSNQTTLPKNPPIAHPTTRPPLRIVGRSRAGRVIRLPAKLHNIVVSTTGGSSVVA